MGQVGAEKRSVSRSDGNGASRPNTTPGRWAAREREREGSAKLAPHGTGCLLFRSLGHGVGFLDGVDQQLGLRPDFATGAHDDSAAIEAHLGWNPSTGEHLHNRRSSRFTAANRGAGRTGTSWRAGRQVLEKEECGLFR